MHKAVFIIFFVMMVPCLFVSGQTNISCTDIYFLNKTFGVVAGSNGNIKISRDGGIHWKQFRVTDRSIRNVQFLNDSVGLVLSDTKLLYTKDGGRNWEDKLTFDEYTKLGIQILNDSTWLIGGHGILKTTNYGSEWIKDTSSRYDYTSDFSFANEKIGIASGSSKVYKTTDGGNLWFPVISALPSLYGRWEQPQMLDTSTILISYSAPLVVNEGYINCSLDGGNTWKILTGGYSFGIRYYYFFSLNKGWISTANYQLIYVDLINHTRERFVLDIGKFCFLDEKTAFGLSGRNILYTEDGWHTYKIIDSMLTGISRSESIVSAYKLNQNYPNPFNPTTTISYSIPKESYVELKIYDLLGHEVSTLVSKEQGAGEYKVEFNGSDLSSGMYIYTIRAGEFRDSKKLLFLK